MSQIFETENEINLPLNYILENIKKHLDITFKVNLSKNADIMTRLEHYNKFESTFTLEEKSYISSCKNRNYRSVIAKLRSSTFNKIKVDSGRYRNIPKDKPLCQRCNCGSIDDELHVLLYCAGFYSERKKIMLEVCKTEKHFLTLNDSSKLEILLSHPTIVNLTAKYILSCNF